MNRTGKFAAVAILGTLSLTACGGGDAKETATSAASAAGSAASQATSAAGSAAPGGAEAQLACPAGSLKGEGSSAQKTAMDSLKRSYQDKCGNKGTIEYNPTGSGKGITNFNAKLVDWAGSDSALKDKPKDDGTIETDAAKKRCGGAEAWNLPMVVGPVAFAYNLEGVDELVLTPEILSNIFAGKITTWNDEAIKKVNPDATLPGDKITVFYRSGESGTTENVTKYLKAAAPAAFTAEPSKKWPMKAGEGKDGSSGVAEAVKSTKGAISYMELSYAQSNDLGMAKLDNGGGAVELNSETVGKAVEGAEIKGKGHDLKLGLKYDIKEADAYPAILVTYEIVCSKGLDAGKTALLKDYLTYMASDEAQGKLEDEGYGPLPKSMQTKVQEAIKAIA
ncbi:MULTISPECIES: phosphate ABC transporter substrate-binding protein PstS [unclassified Luteococcus]|uniref:phosphate ABC transporter substrate-binding protein PstS n=1 Tax=unclassified Luteococcus TaxID=2639923 RepID=UPI00313A76CD